MCSSCRGRTIFVSNGRVSYRRDRSDAISLCCLTNLRAEDAFSIGSLGIMNISAEKNVSVGLVEK